MVRGEGGRRKYNMVGIYGGEAGDRRPEKEKKKINALGVGTVETEKTEKRRRKQQKQKTEKESESLSSTCSRSAGTAVSSSPPAPLQMPPSHVPRALSLIHLTPSFVRTSIF